MWPGYSLVAFAILRTRKTRLQPGSWKAKWTRLEPYVHKTCLTRLFLVSLSSLVIPWTTKLGSTRLLKNLSTDPPSPQEKLEKGPFLRFFLKGGWGGGGSVHRLALKVSQCTWGYPGLPGFSWLAWFLLKNQEKQAQTGFWSTELIRQAIYHLWSINVFVVELAAMSVVERVTTSNPWLWTLDKASSQDPKRSALPRVKDILFWCLALVDL